MVAIATIGAFIITIVVIRAIGTIVRDGLTVTINDTIVGGRVTVTVNRCITVVIDTSIELNTSVHIHGNVRRFASLGWVQVELKKSTMDRGSSIRYFHFLVSTSASLPLRGRIEIPLTESPGDT